jgi:hypothetical protein
MDHIDRSDLSQLVDVHAESCVSIYMPTHRRGREVVQDPSRLKNLLRRAEQESLQAGMRSAQVESLLTPARELLVQQDFWNHQSDGLAVFLAPGFSRVLRLPLEFEETVVVAQRFHIKPLLPMLERDGRFYVLAVSQNRVRLFEGSRFAIREIEPNGVPKSLGDALRLYDFEKSLQLHSSGPHPTGARGPAVFHGQGGAEEDRDVRLAEFFRGIDRGLGELLGGERAPLVLAGVEYYLPIYRGVSTYAHLVDEVVAGNPDTLGARELHDRTWPLVADLFAKHEQQVLARYRQLAGTGRTTDDLSAVVGASRNGQVDALLVAIDRHCWGKIGEDGTTVVHETRAIGDRDLIDAAVAATLRNGGTVLAKPAAELPGPSPVSAILRY